MAFYLQTGRQMKQMNSELEQYLRFFTEYRQRNWLGKLRMRADIRRKGKVEKAIEFTERMRRVQEKAGAVLRKIQEENKRISRQYYK